MATMTIPEPSWAMLRRVFYVGLFTWLVGVRLMGVNPFDDFGEEGGFGFSTLFDTIGLVAVWIFGWTVLWPLRPKL